MEAQSSKLRSEKMWEAHMHGGDKPGQVKIVSFVNQLKILRLILKMMDILKIGNSSSYFLLIQQTI